MQLNNGTDASGKNTIAPPSSPYYLGPMIVAQRDRPVRVKFTNKLPTGSGGNLFLPVDTTIDGAGTGPNGGTQMYTQNRATLHLHGGAHPVDQRRHAAPVDHPGRRERPPTPRASACRTCPTCPIPGPGSLTFFYTNQQSARLMFYHDHAVRHHPPQRVRRRGRAATCCTTRSSRR